MKLLKKLMEVTRMSKHKLIPYPGDRRRRAGATRKP